jgi:hypothetical protein
MRPFTEASDLPRGTGVDAPLAGTAARQRLHDRRPVVGAMSTYQRAALGRDRDRHLAAVARSLGWAQESAARGDYADALGWVQMVEAIGDLIPEEYEIKRRAWRDALAENRTR